MGFHKRFNSCALGEITAMGRDGETIFVWLDRITINAGDSRSIARQRKGDGSADTVCRACHECAFAIEIDEHGVVPLERCFVSLNLTVIASDERSKPADVKRKSAIAPLHFYNGGLKDLMQRER
jgi:hypothetical protein